VADVAAVPWINRNVAAMGATSLLSDASHEAATSVLPGFLAVLGLPPLALGVIEGASDALASFVKLCSGWLGDRTANRWGLGVLGYALTGTMPLVLALAASWPAVLAAKLLGWLGKGMRGPVRDAMLAASVATEARGRAFAPAQGIVAAGAAAGLLYVVRNGVYAAASYPVGALSDRTGRPVVLLAAGYLIGALVAVGTALAFVGGIDNVAFLAALFVGSGVLAAFQDTLEAVSTAFAAAAAAMGAGAAVVAGTVARGGAR